MNGGRGGLCALQLLYLAASIPKTSLISIMLFDFAAVPTTPSVSMQILSPWPSTVIWFSPALWSLLPAAVAGFSYPLIAMSGRSRLRFYTGRKTSEWSFLRSLHFSPISCIIDSYSIPYHAAVLKGGFPLAFYDGIYDAIDHQF